MSIRRIKDYIILLAYVLKCTLFTESYAAFDQGIVRSYGPFKTFSILSLLARSVEKYQSYGLESVSADWR